MLVIKSLLHTLKGFWNLFLGIYLCNNGFCLIFLNILSQKELLFVQCFKIKVCFLYSRGGPASTNRFFVGLVLNVPVAKRISVWCILSNNSFDHIFSYFPLCILLCLWKLRKGIIYIIFSFL